MAYRNLNKSEIEQLIQNGCSALSWENILIQDGFNPERIHHISFHGNVKIGRFDKNVSVADGITVPAGLYNSHIQDCIIHDNVYISQVKFLVNYEIDSEAVIYNTGELYVTGETNFGNGTEIEVLNEGGNRDLPIFDKLSAQVAYLLVTWRHDSEFIKNLTGIIKTYTDSRKTNCGRIGKNVKLINCQTVHNVWIGDQATIDGALRLSEGTIASTTEDPCFVGAGVIADHFMILSGSKVDSGALLQNTFVGQGVQMGKQFSAENSAFFANCEGFHSECCSVFAGPYSVTHHKSTLLIAGMFSFYNAGSGTNQSNHMYKLGPVHQGILERGAKTGSFSYLLWPSRIGAFSAVVGKHYANFDTSDFPFSYITEEHGRSVLTPAMNLITVGTRRDSIKWPNRDRRKDPVQYDLINFDLFSPFIVVKVLRGIELLINLYENSPREQEYIFHNGIHIKRLLLKSTRKYYEMIIDISIGNEVLKRLKDLPDTISVEALKNHLSSDAGPMDTEWVDAAGLVSPRQKITDLTRAVSEKKIANIEELYDALNEIYRSYDSYTWEFCAGLIEQQTGKKPVQLSAQELAAIISDWQKSSLKLNNMILQDADKEFSRKSQIGYGIDGDAQTAELDFANVRGTLDTNKFIKETRADSEQINKTAEHWLRILQ